MTHDAEPEAMLQTADEKSHPAEKIRKTKNIPELEKKVAVFQLQGETRIVLRLQIEKLQSGDDHGP